VIHCCNTTLHPKTTVPDLGSGEGINVVASARRVMPTGKAYGLGITDEMLDLARRETEQAGV
jgi:ubiquinone/menaquinone biosynthesis C-methylase UbiE